MPKRVAAERIAAEQDHVHYKNDRPDADAESVRKMKSVVSEDDDEQKRKIEKVSMNVLDDQWEPALTAVIMSRLADRASGRVRPEGLVVGAAVVVTGESKTARRPQDE